MTLHTGFLIFDWAVGIIAVLGVIAVAVMVIADELAAKGSHAAPSRDSRTIRTRATAPGRHRAAATTLAMQEHQS